MIRECLLIFVAFCGGEVCGILTMLLPGPRDKFGQTVMLDGSTPLWPDPGLQPLSGGSGPATPAKGRPKLRLVK